MSFDQVIDRQKYPSMKWSRAMWQEHFGSDEMLPFWVADMDFPAPPEVIQAIRRRVEHGIYGYEYNDQIFFDSIFHWYARRHQWTINPSYLELCPSVLNAIAILINQHSQEGNGIILQPPVFFEFRMAIRTNNRRIVKNPLKLIKGKYQMDFEDLEAKAADPNNRMMIICNPHNPVGRVWTREELARVGEICQKHNVLVISDEIHGDIVYKPYRYTPYATITDTIAGSSFTCISPAKTFNIAGLVDAMTIIPNSEYRQRFHNFAHRFQINKTNIFTQAATKAAYNNGEEWLNELLAYLRSNISFLQFYLHNKLPQVELIQPEGTYMVWLDFRGLGLDAKELERFLSTKARIALNPGYWFGREGAGFARMNIACPRSILEAALIRISDNLIK